MTTISRGLVAIKHFKSGFQKFLQDSRFSGVIRNGVETTTGVKAADFKENVRKSVQSGLDQIEADFKLRCQINKANHDNKIVIDGREMTISDALTYRTHTLPLIIDLRSRLVSALRNAQIEYQKLDATYQESLKKSNSDEMKELLEKTEQPTILEMQGQIDDLDKKISFFSLEFDALLTEKNPLIIID